MKKVTEDLMNELNSAENVYSYLEQNEDNLVHLSLSEYLRAMLEKYDVEKGTVFRRANMAETNYGYEVLRDDRKKISRDKLIQLCFGYPLTIEETQQALRCAGYRALYPRDKRDAYILFALKEKLTITQLNELLYSNGEPMLE